MHAFIGQTLPDVKGLKSAAFRSWNTRRATNQMVELFEADLSAQRMPIGSGDRSGLDHGFAILCGGVALSVLPMDSNAGLIAALDACIQQPKWDINTVELCW